MTVSAAIKGDSLADRVQAAVEIAGTHADGVDREGAFPAAAIDALKAGRLLGAAVPSVLGGEGLGFAELSAICIELGRACAATGMIFAMHQICVVNLLDCGLDNAWHRKYLARAAREQLLFASATTEAGVGGDLRQSICALETSDDRFALSKVAPVISYGEYADAIFATARSHPDAAPSDQVLAVLQRDQYELERIAVWDSLGMRGTCSHGYRLRAEAPAEQVLPKPFADIAAESMVTASHILWSSVWCGVASDALGRAQAFVTAEARKQPGEVPPGVMRLAEAFGRFRMMEATLSEAVTRWEGARGEPEGAQSLAFSLAINALKTSISSTALDVVDSAMMICGLQGYKNGGPYSLGRHLRDIHSARLMIGNDRILASTGQMLLMQRRPFAKAF